MLPTDRTIRFEVASADVIHSFWVPEFLFKLDVIPGNENGRDNVFEVTVREEGAYVGRCAELCGTYHAYMNFEVRAVSGDDYDAYLEARESGLDTFEALEEIGQPGLSSTTTPFEHLQNATPSSSPVADVAHRRPDPDRTEARGGHGREGRGAHLQHHRGLLRRRRGRLRLLGARSRSARRRWCSPAA